MNTTTTPIQAISARIEQAFKKAEEVYNRPFQRCSIRLDINPSSNTAGQACYGKRLIRINRTTYHSHPSHVLDVTCPHEVAHIVSVDLYGMRGTGHGPAWKSVMRNIGLKPERCHSLVTPRSTSKPVYQCERPHCKKQIMTGKTTHSRVSNGKAKFPPCKCGGTYVFVGTVKELMLKKELTCLEMPENMK